MKKLTIAAAAILGLTTAAQNVNLKDLKGDYGKHGKDLKKLGFEDLGKYKGDLSKILEGGYKKGSGNYGSSGPFHPSGLNYDYTCRA